MVGRAGGVRNSEGRGHTELLGMVEARKFFNVREGQKFSTSTEGGGDIL